MACVHCHTKDHDKMLEDWKTELANEIEEVKKVKAAALEILAECIVDYGTNLLDRITTGDIIC